jgi:hypothetical protein
MKNLLIAALLLTSVTGQAIERSCPPLQIQELEDSAWTPQDVKKAMQFQNKCNKDFGTDSCLLYVRKLDQGTYMFICGQMLLYKSPES